MSFIAGYLLGLEDGGGGQSEEKFDHIAGLPTVFAFDMADGWRCELCADSNPTDCPETFGTRYDSWSEEFQSTVVYTKPTKAYYLRIFNGSELKLITDVLPFNNSCAKWYASNGTVVGDLMKTVISEYGDFFVKYVDEYYSTDSLKLPTVSIGYTLTQTVNGTAETYSGNQNVFYSKFISKSEIDVNVFADFVNAVRKFSDEFNSNNTT